MTAMTARTYTCSRCSRTSQAPGKEGWLLRSTPVVVQGITLGVCGVCMTGAEPSAKDDESSCSGCKGDYRPSRGTYYLAEWGDTFSAGESWACWDRACVEGWLDEQPYDCSHCGGIVDMTVYEVIDGDRKPVRS